MEDTAAGNTISSGDDNNNEYVPLMQLAIMFLMMIWMNG